MQIAGPVLILIFLFLSFVISAFEKVNDWKKSMDTYTEMYKDYMNRMSVIAVLILILILEVVTSTLLAYGIYDLIAFDTYNVSRLSLISAAITLIILLIGLRILQDYKGSANLGIYFLLCVFCLYWIQ